MLRDMRILFFLAIAFFPSLSFAGGSVTWKEVQAVLAKKPNLKELIESTFEIEKDGEAIRLGRQFENLGGLRIAPTGSRPLRRMVRYFSSPSTAKRPSYLRMEPS